VLAVAVLGGGASIAAAGSGDPKDATDAAAAAKADAAAAGGPKDAPAETKPQAPGGVPAGLLVQTRAALDALVAGGTIDQTQADGIQARVASGSVDESEVVASRLLDQGQMQRVEDVLRTIKQSYAGA
jgi:hypothetical protein